MLHRPNRRRRLAGPPPLALEEISDLESRLTGAYDDDLETLRRRGIAVSFGASQGV
jgi:hypothetical protein